MRYIARHLPFLVAMSLLTASLCLNGYLLVQNRHSETPVAQGKKLDVDLQSAVDSALEHESLLTLASGTEYRHSNEAGKIELVDQWAEGHLSVMDSLKGDQKQKFLSRVAKSLDDLLAEKDFDPKDEPDRIKL